MNLDHVSFHEHVVAVDHLAVERRRSPDARVLHGGGEILVDARREVAHGRPARQRERRRAIGGLSRLLRVDAHDAQRGERAPGEIVEPAAGLHGNGGQRPVVIEQLVDDRDVLLAPFTVDPGGDDQSTLDLGIEQAGEMGDDDPQEIRAAHDVEDTRLDVLLVERR